MLDSRIIIPPLDIYLFGLSIFSLGSEKVTMKIKILMENPEKGIFLKYRVYLEPQRETRENQRLAEGMALLWESVKASDCQWGIVEGILMRTVSNIRIIWRPS